MSPDWPDSHYNSGSVVKKICVHDYTAIRVGNVDIFVLLNFENKINREIYHFNYNPKYYDKCKFALKLTRLIAFSNLCPLKVEQKYQRCQFCVLRKNSTMKILWNYNILYVPVGQLEMLFEISQS